MNDLIEKIHLYVKNSSSKIKTLEEENKSLKDKLIQKELEIESIKQEKPADIDLKEKYAELTEERDLIKSKVEGIIKTINSLNS
ncbi:MAG: hypothetical protein HQK84_01290 [Nitrospinae bacterium]|nr:hypothetical protein [Nitrospinota bacterium]